MSLPFLRDLLGDVSEESFFREYWEKRVLHVERNVPGFYDSLVTFKEVDEYLARTDLRYPYIRLVQSGGELPLNEYAHDMTFGENLFQGNIDLDKVFSLYNSGATLCMQLQHLAFSGLREFGNQVEEQFGFKTQSTMFLTPASSQGFTAHYDTHDFFVFQVHGEKEWLIYDEQHALPLGSSRVFDDEVDLKDSTPRRYVLRPGDLLYVPRGVYHEAKTSSESSLQVSFGVFPVMWVDLLHKIIDRAAMTNKSLRTVAKSPLTNDDLAQRAMSEFSAALSSAPPETILADMQRDVLRQQGKDCRGRLLDTEAKPSLCSATPLSRRAIHCRLEKASSGTVLLSFFDKELEFPITVAEELTFILGQNDVFAASDIPTSLAHAELISLVKLLVVEGLITSSSKNGTPAKMSSLHALADRNQSSQLAG